MKLQKFEKKDIKNKKIIILSLVGIFLLVIGFAIFKTYAFYEENKAYNILKGTMPDFGYDIKLLSIIVDGKESNSIPERGLYRTDISCTTGDGVWDYNAWSLILSNTEKHSRCYLTFTSDLTETEYNDYIAEGVAKRRNTYRGNDITEYHEDGSLYAMIENGTFDDIYVGDYIEANNIKWLVADIDNYLYTGSTSFTKHHLTMIPNAALFRTYMNSTDTTVGGYYGSEMVTTTLNSTLSTYITPVFGNHILTYTNILTNSINVSVPSANYSYMSGASNGWNWYSRQIDLMSEVNVYGTNVLSSSGYDTGIDNQQYAIFKLRPDLIKGESSNSYWLKNVSNSGHFVYIDISGTSNIYPSSYSLGVRPRFLIG